MNLCYISGLGNADKGCFFHVLVELLFGWMLLSSYRGCNMIKVTKQTLCKYIFTTRTVTDEYMEMMQQLTQCEKQLNSTFQTNFLLESMSTTIR